MKKIIKLATVAVLLMIGAYAESNTTELSLWDKAKQVTTNAAHTVVDKYNDTNFTAIKDAAVIKSKTAIDATKEVASNLSKAAKIKYLEVKYPELMIRMEDIWQRGQIIDDDESFSKIVISFNSLVGDFEGDLEKKELVLSRMEEFLSMRNPDKD